ncbi:hypothetical protein HK100_003153 [Physocladia obscura]|uniref:Phosphorylase kinase alphabeta n=1 Tax=Physocladia obscura TaxID=109957 RepID=A0AAD5T9D2_9FUNG|nr:hypothetical protein HK100_003153 [Physocladia obscura]
MAAWGLALAYRRIDDDEGRAYELEHATIKCMRGILFAYMRQAHKVELFKNSQSVLDSLHAKFNTATGDTVVGDKDWGHLQLDATSIFVLQLAQMTAAGTLVIFTMDEVNFIQNLVFYIERAYRTPDYGIWERGDKINHGMPELNSSSIGMVVAALQAINGVIHVLPDEITRNYTTLHSALPRESNSKEVDAAVLSVISFPAFAVSDTRLIVRTRNEIVKKLGGNYGFKRFLRDGHQTVLEDTSRLYYDPHELKIFEGIECEWPLFYTYLILDGLFRDDREQVQKYRDLLEPLLVESSSIPKFRVVQEHINPLKPISYGSISDRVSAARRRSSVMRRPQDQPPSGTKLVPELYIVPKEYIEDEKANPGSVKRIANENVPLAWAQSLYILGSLIQDDLLSPAELDPLGRRNLPFRPRQGSEVVVQMVLLSESSDLQTKLSTFGLETQTLENCAPVTISLPSALRDAYSSLGENVKLGLSGRPNRPIGTLGTSKIYKCQGHMYAFLPHFMDNEEFYLVSDNNYLVSVLEQELAFVKNHWWYPGRPTIVVMLTREMLGDFSSSKDQSDQQRWRYNHRDSKRNLLNFMTSLRSGMCGGVRVRVARLSEVVNTACIESLDFMVSPESAGETEDWHTVLKGEWHHQESQKLHSENEKDARSVSRPPRGRSLRRRSTGGENSSFLSNTIPKSPLKSPYYTEEPESYDTDAFKLKNHLEPEMAKLELGPSVTESIARSPIRGVSSNRAAARGALGNLAGFEENQGANANDSRRGSYTFDIVDMAQFKTSITNSKENSTHSLADNQKVVPSSKLSNGVTANTESSTEDTPNDGVSALTLTLGDPANVDVAGEMLVASTSIFDQIDLLHYLLSCCGLEYKIGNLGTIQSLLEEIYVKAMHMKEWSIVRQVAGLLKKTVNSLTSNVADLLIRGKPITIGFGPNEYFITNPLSPEALSAEADVREAPLVQEILTYLGSMIRSTASVFDGIQRIRTYLFIIAMREEISRLKGCDEEEAVEHMMQLSPFELKMLLNTVLTARDQINNAADSSVGLSTTYRWRNWNKSNSLKLATSGVALPSQLIITAQSGGYNSGNFAKIDLNRDGSSAPVQTIFGRGLNVVVLDPLDGVIIESASFDTHISTEESYEFVQMIESLDVGSIVIVVAKDDCAENLTTAAKTACESLGSSKIRDLGFRDSWCLIGEKGAEPGSVIEEHIPASQGPTAQLTRSFDLVAKRKMLLESYPQNSQFRMMASGAIGTLMPSNGKWLRRRKNDGALNRVPTEFYPKVWKVLSKCHGIFIGKGLLPRDPTISEKTPEELNFALQVESYLDYIRDPAERQICVECLMVVSRIAERNPEIPINSGNLDLMKIIRDAVSRFWIKWIDSHSNAAVSSFVSNSELKIDSESKDEPAVLDLSFEKHEKIARRLFFDLAQEGEEGTMAYLAKSSVQISFAVGWQNGNLHDDENTPSRGRSTVSSIKSTTTE